MSSAFDLNYYKRDHDGMRLDFSSTKRLYGRDSELEALHNMQTGILPHQTIKGRSQNKPRHICWVHGLSGSGKTALCHAGLSMEKSKYQPYDLTDKLFFIEGKYNQLYTSTTTPYSAIVNAFDMLGQQVQDVGGFSAQMKESLKFEGTILTKLIPSFSTYATRGLSSDSDEEDSRLLTVEHDPGPDDMNKDRLMLASERLAVAFRSFLRKFTVQIRPLVFFLDDLQWGDRYSQELIAAILHDDELENFLFVASFRDDKPELTEVFRRNMKDLVSTDCLTDIALKDLDLDSVNHVLASTLSAELEVTEPLSQVVHRKTHGNPYFVTQLLEQLHAQNLLKYNFASLQWEWDIESANSDTDLSDNVVDVVTLRLQGIPSRVRRVLKLAACLGYIVDVALLKRLDLDLNVGRPNLLSVGSDSSLSVEHPATVQQSASQDSKEAADLKRTQGSAQSLRGQGSMRNVRSVETTASDLNNEMMKERFETQLFDAALQRAEEEGFVERTGSVVKFSHDRVQQCVYNLIEVGRGRDLLHYQIGSYLKQRYEDTTESKDSAQLLFLAVDQLNRGSSLIDNDEGRISLIKLNNEASKVAKQKAGIEAVANFLRKAIELIRPSFWLYYYDLVLEVFNSSAEVDFSLGMLEEAKETIDAIMENAVRKDDTVRALVVQYQMYGLRCQYKEAIAHGCRILKLLGEHMPKKVSLVHVAMEYFKARKACKNKSDEFFTELKPTESTKIKTILKILQVGSIYGWNADANFAGLAFLRAIRISVREGSSGATPYIYSGYGFMLGLFGDYNEAFRFGQLALKARARWGKETFSSACPLTFGNLNHLQLPLSASLEPYIAGYRVGLETGDLFFGSICISCYALIYLTCGLPLASFADDMRNFGAQLQICHQDVPLAFILPTHQLALNLMGKSDDPLDLSREAIKRTHNLFSDNLLLCDEASRMIPADVLYMWYLQLYNAYILEDVAVADKTLKRILALKKEARRFGGTHMLNYFLPFMDGLVGLWLAKEKPGSKTGPRVAKAAIAELTQISKTRPVNSITLLMLLRAEAKARKKSTEIHEARRAYDEVISRFSRSGLNHFNAIANELAGKYMLEKLDTPAAEDYLGKALAKWDEYNALVKVELMMKEHSFLHSISAHLKEARGGSIQGRARFDAGMDSFRASTASVEARRSGNFDASSGSLAGSYRGSLSKQRTPSISEH